MNVIVYQRCKPLAALQLPPPNMCRMMTFINIYECQNQWVCLAKFSAVSLRPKQLKIVQRARLRT